MTNLTDRLSGLFCLLFGVALWTYFIPTQVETVDYGAIRPKTMPQILSVLLGLSGLALMLKPGDGHDLKPLRLGKTSLVVATLVAGLWLLGQFGFVYVAAPLALVLMLIMGERRLLWLGVGTIGMPALIWFVVSVLLERPLP